MKCIKHEDKIFKKPRQWSSLKPTVVVGDKNKTRQLSRSTGIPKTQTVLGSTKIVLSVWYSDTKMVWANMLFLSIKKLKRYSGKYQNLERNWCKFLFKDVPGLWKCLKCKHELFYNLEYPCKWTQIKPFTSNLRPTLILQAKSGGISAFHIIFHFIIFITLKAFTRL